MNAGPDSSTPTVPRARLTRRRLLIALAVVLIVVIAAVLLLSGPLSPTASTVALAPCIEGSSGGCIRFPGVTGTTLNGKAVTLPDDFAGAFNFVVVSFDEGQLERAQTWLPAVQALAATRPDFAYYSVPALPDMAPAMRANSASSEHEITAQRSSPEQR